MSRLYEHEAKGLARRLDIPVPKGRVAKTPEEAAAVAAEIGLPVMVKAQVLAGGRGKAGGIRGARTLEETASVAAQVLGMTIGDQIVETVLIEEQLEVAKEMYLAVLVDDATKGPLLVCSERGGMEVDAALADGRGVSRLPIDVRFPVRSFHARALINTAAPNAAQREALAALVPTIYQLYRQYDATTLEVNPLVCTADGRVIVADMRVELDDYALFRHPELGLEPIKRGQAPERSEQAWYLLEAKDYRGTWAHIQLVPESVVAGGGYIGFHAVGGGESMISMDALNRVGLRPGNYCDTSGAPPASKIYRAARIILAQPNIQGFYFITCIANQPLDETARGLYKALMEMRPEVPVLIRIAGNKDREAHAILRRAAAVLPGAVEIYGREADEDFCAERMAGMVTESTARRRS